MARNSIVVRYAVLSPDEGRATHYERVIKKEAGNSRLKLFKTIFPFILGSAALRQAQGAVTTCPA